MMKSSEVFAAWLFCFIAAILGPIAWCISIVWEFFGWVFSGFRRWGG